MFKVRLTPENKVNQHTSRCELDTWREHDKKNGDTVDSESPSHAQFLLCGMLCDGRPLIGYGNQVERVDEGVAQ